MGSAYLAQRATIESILADPEAEAANADAFAAVREALGHTTPRVWPIRSAALVHLLADGLGYRFDLADCQKAIDRRYVPGAGRDANGDRVWTANEAKMLVGHLEARRRWNPDSPLHRAKLSKWELGERTAQLRDEPGVFEDLGDVPLEDLLINLLVAENHETRIGLWVAVRQKLGSAYYDT